MKEDWVEATLGEVFETVTGNTPSKKEDDNYGSEVPFVKPPQINNGFLEPSTEFLSIKGKTKARILPANSILVTCIGNLGRIGLNKTEVAFNQQINAIKPLNKILSKYTFYQAQSINFRNQLEKLSTSTTVALVNKTSFNSVKFTLAPLPIQRAIVAKIEELFSSLDSGIADLKKAQDQLVIYRQAVLKKAFEGEYSKNTFNVVEVDTLCEVVRGGSPRPAGDERFYNGDIPFMKVRDISRNRGAFIDKAEYTIKEAGLNRTRLVSPNTLLLTNSGATLGIPAITKIQTTFNDGIAAFLNLNDDLLYHYYYWVSKTAYLRNLNQGAAQPNLNTSVIGKMRIPIYLEKAEHSKIVREIESRLSVCDKVEESITESLEKAQALRQSILKKAFEGKLLSEEEIERCIKEKDYEPASVLLERIKKEKVKYEAI